MQPVSEAPIPTDRPPTPRFTNRIRASEYEIQEEEGIAIAVAPDSTKLPIYHGIINDQANSKTIIDSGATTIYIRDSLVKEQGFKITKIPPRTVIVANHDRIQVDGIVTVDLKLNGLPSERIAAYTFPLGNIDIILGLPWLKKHRLIQIGTEMHTNSLGMDVVTCFTLGLPILQRSKSLRILH